MKKFLSALMVAGSIALSSPVFAADMLQIKGSDTLINLVQRLAEVYMEKNPGEYIAVTGGGSGTGIAAMINNKCDIANSSRDMKDKEIAMAAENGVDVRRVVIALDGLSVIVHKDNPVRELTVDQVGQIFRGEITNWKEVGGPDMPINLYGRQSNSGTYVFFRDDILKDEYSPQMKNMNGNAQIVEGIKSDRSAIGYVGVGYIQNDADLGVVRIAAREGARYASPLNAEDVKNGAYPVARTLNQYIASSPSQAVKGFIAFELSAEGQQIAEEEGFFSVPLMYQEENAQLGF